MKQRWTIVALFTLLGGCSGGSPAARYDVAQAAASVIRAANSDDQAAFDSYIDWPAVRSNIEAQLAQAKGAAGAIQPAADGWSGAADSLVRPSSLHFKASPGSYGGMLGAAHLALMMRATAHGRLCLSESFWARSCVLTFAREGSEWKVVGISLELFHAAAPRWAI